MARVRIGTCSGPADAALVRAAFEAHDIPVLINAEQHASMLGGLGGAFVPLHILVAEEDAEEAAALLRDLREHDHEADRDHDPYHEPGPGEPDPADFDDADASASASGVEVRVDRRRRTGVVLLLGLCVTFGTAHMYTGAWLRGLCLAGIEAIAFRYVVVGSKLGTPLLLAAIATDVVGALLRVRAVRSRIPEARVKR